MRPYKKSIYEYTEASRNDYGTVRANGCVKERLVLTEHKRLLKINVPKMVIKR